MQESRPHHESGFLNLKRPDGAVYPAESAVVVKRPTQNKLLGLEIVRFVCAFAVLLYHYQHFTFVNYHAADFARELQPGYSALRLLFDYGLWGVNIFWCISGFIFFWKYRNSIADRAIGGKKFFVLRFSRLYPLHIATLLLVAAFQLIYFRLVGTYFVYPINDAWHFLLQLFMASNWGLEDRFSFNGPIWSISVEVMVYFLFYLFLRYLGRSAWINIGIIVVGAMLKHFKLSPNVVDCLLYFYIGGLAAMAALRVQTARKRAWINAAAWTVAVSAPLAAWILHAFDVPKFPYLFCLAYTPVLLFCVSQQGEVSRGAQRFIEAAGNMTYSSYLLHFPIQLITVTAFTMAGVAVPLYHFWFFAAYLAVTLTAAYYTYRYFEAPAQDAIRASFR
jgi:peptidoglycan/LPS O-acetylase OafA/YrhL